MARLPVPGSDDGQWGTVLNDYLSTVHNSDGTFKDGIISEQKLDSALQSKVNGGGVSGVSSVNTRTGAVTLTATDVGLANVNNTSDANKPVSTATQTALDGKQPLDSDLTAIAALSPANDEVIQRKSGAWTNRTPAQLKTDLALTKSDVGLSNVDNTTDANKPVSTATQTALNGKLASAGSNIVTLADSATQFIRVNIPDDGSPTGGWPDRYVNFFDGTRTGYFNEYGEVRARPGKTNTVALRAMGHASGSSGDIFQVTNSGQTATYLGISSSAASLTVPLSSTQNITAPNIGTKVIVLDAGDPVPGGTPAGTIIFRRS